VLKDNLINYIMISYDLIHRWNIQSSQHDHRPRFQDWIWCHLDRLSA